MLQLNFPNAVRDEKDFYGRVSELESITQIFLSGQRVPVVIIGERRIGKTSLQNVVIQRLQKVAEPRFVPLWVEPRGLTTVDDFAKSFLQRLCSHLGKKLPDTDLVREGHFHLETRGQFEDTLRQLIGTDQNSVYVLCVDEFDEIVRNLSEDELLRLEGLFFPLIEKTTLPLALLLTMTREPNEFEDKAPSPLTAISEIKILSPFSLEEMDDLVKNIFGSQGKWPENEIRQLYRLSGGHPYFTKLLLAKMIEMHPFEKTEQVITRNMIDKALEQTVDDPRANVAVKNLYRMHFNSHEKELLLLLADQDGSITKEELRMAGLPWLSAARRLTKRHYLSQEIGGFNFRVNFLCAWLRNWIEFEEEMERWSTLKTNLEVPHPNIEIDDVLGQVRVSGYLVKLSTQDFGIMHCLVGWVGELVTREQLIETVWNTDQGVSNEMVDTAIYRLRKKLGDNGQHIETRTGQGFVLHQAILISKKENT